MTEYTILKCEQCGQKLRFPHNIGGLVVACPTCGQKFHSDFRLQGSEKKPFFSLLPPGESFSAGFFRRLLRTLYSRFVKR